MKKLNCLLWICCFALPIMAQSNYADLNTAKVVCNTGAMSLTPNGAGNIDELEASFPSLKETNIVWLKFTIATGGALRFEITPRAIDGQYEDIDFVLFEESTGLVTYSISGPKISGKTRTFCVGEKTGVGNNATDTEEDIDCANMVDGFTKDIMVSSGQVYHLAINSFFTNSTFGLKWKGTCTFDCNGSNSKSANHLFNVPQKMLVKDVFPNPTNQTLTWDIESESIKEANISIMDVTGRIVFNRQEQLIKGTQRLTFDIADLQSGLYSIALSYDNQVQYSQKFVKSN